MAGRPAALGQTRWQRDEFLRFLPEDTVTAALIPDLELTLQHLASNRVLLRLFPDPPVFFRSAIVHKIESPWLSPQILPRLAEISVSPHQIGMIVMLDSAEHPGNSVSDHLAYEFAVLAEIDDHDRALSLLLDEIVPALQTINSDMELGVFEFQGETLYRIADLDIHMYCAIIDHTFLAAMNRDTLQRLVLEFRQEDHAATAQYFASAIDNAAAADLIIGFNLPALWPSIRSRVLQACAAADAPDVAFLTHILENSHLPLAAWDLTIGEETITENLRTRYPRPAIHEIDTVPGSTTDSSNASRQNRSFISERYVSDQALYYHGRHINLAAWWQQVLVLLETAPEAHHIRTIEMWRIRLETILRTSLESVFAELGSIEIGMAWYPAELIQRRPRQTNSLADLPFLLMFHTDAVDTTASGLERLSDTLDPAPSRSFFQGVEIRAYQFPFFGATQTLFHAIVDDVLLFSWSDIIIKDAIRVARYGQSLAETQEYRSAAFPPSSLTRGYLSLSDTARRLTAYWERQPLYHHVSIPETTELLAAQPPMTWATTVEPEGFLTTARSPLGGPLLVLLVMWLTFFPTP